MDYMNTNDARQAARGQDGKIRGKKKMEEGGGRGREIMAFFVKSIANTVLNCMRKAGKSLILVLCLDPTKVI